MNKRVFFGHNDLRFFYYRYKDSNYYSLSILITAILLCILLIFQIILPQAQIYFSIRKEAVALGSKIKTINENINFMNNLDKSVVDSQLQVVTRSLPADKDFEGILNVISQASVRSGVSVSDFSFQLDKPAQTNGQVKSDHKSDLVAIDITVDIKGSTDGGKKFLAEIAEKIPVVEITNVKGDSNSLIIDMHFYYKTLPKIAFKEDELITSVSDSKQALIRQLSAWQETSIVQENTSQAGTSSAVPLF